MSHRMFGFVLFPNRTIMKEAVKLSNTIENNLSINDLETQIPHVTVLQAPINLRFNYQEALDEFRDYAGFNVEPRTMLGNVYQQDKYVMWGLDNAGWLSRFNSIIVNKLAEHIIVPDSKDEKFATTAEEESFKLTGYKRNLSAFEPHITLGKTVTPVTDLPNTGDVNRYVKFHTLAFTEHGSNGAIIKILDSRNLPVNWD